MLKIKNRVLNRTLLVAITAVALVSTACEADTKSSQTQLANPASVYCDQVGGTHVVKTDSSGNQAGWCELSDGQQCDEWALFRGECVPDLAMNKPFEWCSQGMSSPIMSGPDQTAMLPVDLLKPMIAKGLVSPDMPVELVQASRWRCMAGDVWVCMIGANLPCAELGDLSKTPNDKMIEFCETNPGAKVVPAFVTGRATVYEWTCNEEQPVAGRQFAEVDAAGYLSNIWHPLKP